MAERLKEIRQRRGLTAEGLAARCAEIGAPEITRSVIANIETGRRDQAGRRRSEVTVEELLILAYALQVPPVLLVVPLDAGEILQITPKVEQEPLAAAGWVAGDDGMTGILITESFAPPLGRIEAKKQTQDTRPLTLLRHIGLLSRQIEQLGPVRQSDQEELAERALLITRRYAEQLANQIGWLGSLGFTAPELPPEVAEFVRNSVVARATLPPEIAKRPGETESEA